VYAYCLVPDQIHILLSLPVAGSPLGTIVGAFKRYTTKLSWGFGLSGALWQHRFHDRVLRGNEDARTVAEYILANPVRKGLIGSPEEYKWNGTPDAM
jgi:REP element-mobilizing transposase RayT